ncbi:MAG: hypothetical protein JWM47_3796 [Acidimicrobiales bacterium]|nr:hypothetical protein [Acidimicrobiales bacterium]
MGVGTGTEWVVELVRCWRGSARTIVVGSLLATFVLAGCAGTASDPAADRSPPSGAVAGGPVTTAPADPATTAPGASTTTTTEATTTTAAPTTTTTSTTMSPTTTTTVPPLAPEPPGPLQAGSKGTRTEALQQALEDQHYDPGPVDGAFGGQVNLAVWAFQALHGLPRDGIVTPELEAQILARPAQAMLRPHLGPTHTEVDLTGQVMIVWRDGAPALITHVSSGSEVAYCENTDQGRNCGSAITPTGVYRYQRRVDGWRVAPLGRLYNPVYFTGGIAVHGAPSVPNGPASHGCVRIPMNIAGYFPTLVANGDTIEVFRS